MKTIYVGIGELAVSRNPEECIKTMALGSCVGVMTHDRTSGCWGLLHIALPESKINMTRAKAKPGTFADTGIPSLLREMRRAGWDGKTRLVVRLAGGATIMDPNSTFNIGKRNLLAVKKILWAYKLGAIAEHVGGEISRTVTVRIGEGKVTLSSPSIGEWEL
ncbi:chemoreceptor glutamine deamidase CheD [bacterium BMS3Bbin04]|nr:chemoreceptor glutamine deamidase CheD [bacterium BMS3Bbin04]